MKEQILNFSQTEIEEKLEEIEIPERFKNIINTGNMKNKHKNSPLILQPHQGYYREDGEEFGGNIPIPKYYTPISNEVI